jgi:DNA invertase Pin-like site-specific DNA recombinase
MANKRVTRTRPTAPLGTAVAYLRVSTNEQADSGLGLDAQRRTIEDHAAARGITIVEWFTDAGVSGGVMPSKRPAMRDAMAALADRRASILLAAKLDRISRSIKDALDLDHLATKQGWSVTTADMMMDTATPAGRAAMNMLLVFAQFERDMIAQRTRDALAEKKAQGVQLGNPSQLPAAVVERICREAYDGASLRTIAADLMADGITTGSGSATWHAAQVRRVLDGAAGVAVTEQLDLAAHIAAV